jgi:hypothetical protein
MIGMVGGDQTSALYRVHEILAGGEMKRIETERLQSYGPRKSKSSPSSGERERERERESGYRPS